MITLEQEFIASVRRYAHEKHQGTNHLYDGYPYITHLDSVYRALERVFQEVGEESYSSESLKLTAIYSACFTHDLIEDCRVTYGDIISDMGELYNSTVGKRTLLLGIADLTYAVSNEKGKDRSERANDKYYEGIRAVPGAALLKYCDRIANVEYSIMSGSRMANRYSEEMGHFMEMLPTGSDPCLIAASNILKRKLG